MKIVDLSHTVSPHIPIYPGTEPPISSSPCTIDTVGFAEKKITLYSHTGTHVDGPAHIIEGARTLDQMSIDCFAGPSCVLDLSRIKKPTIDIADLEPFECHIGGEEFVLLHTGWDKYWGRDQYFEGYPILSRDSALWLAGHNLKGVGVDAISVDDVGSKTFPIHKILLEYNTIVIENLVNLLKLPKNSFIFFCMPLKLEKADGSPVRAIGVIEGL